MKFALENRVLFTRRRPTRLDQGCQQELTPFLDPAVFALARRLVVPGTDTGPTAQVLGGFKLAHIWSDLGQNTRCGHLLDARDGLQQFILLPIRLQSLLNPGLELFHLSVEQDGVLYTLGDQPAVMIIELMSLQGFGQLRNPLSEAALTQTGNLFGRNRCVGHQRTHHRLTGDAEDIAENAADLDVGYLQYFLYAVLLRRQRGERLLPAPGEISQLNHRARRQETSFQESMSVQMSQVLGVSKVGLLAAGWPVFLSADQHDLEARFQDILDRNPVRSGTLHCHTGAALLEEPRSEFLECRHGRPKRPCLDFPVLIGWTRYHSDC